MSMKQNKQFTAASGILSAVFFPNKAVFFEKTRKLRGVTLCALLLFCLCAAACAKTPAAPPETQSGQQGETAASMPEGSSAESVSSADATEESVSTDATGAASPLLTDGVYISEIFPYTGAYVEDGSNAPCENVCAVVIKNDSAVHYQYLKFTLETAGGAYTFAASTLFSGAQMTVLCENAAAYTDDTLLSLRADALAPFAETPSVHTETLQITYTDGFINVKNLTDAPLTDVYVYYKNTDENGYLGGITYRVPFGDVAAGEVKQASASNMRRETGRVVFTTYGS